MTSSRPPRRAWREFAGEMSVPALLCAYATHYYLSVRALPRPETNLLLIEPVYWILIVSSALFAGLKFRSLLQETADTPDGAQYDAQNNAPGKRPAWFKPLAFIVLTVACVWLMPILGFATTLAAYTFLLLLALGVHRWRVLLLTPVLLAGTLWFSMEWFLNLRLPVGVFY